MRRSAGASPEAGSPVRPRRYAGAVTLLALLLSAAIGCGPAGAQPWPSHPVRLVVPYAPGGPVDIVTRGIGQRLGQAIGQPVVIDNRPGGNTAVAAEHVARSTPDGHTLLLVAPTTSINTLAEPRPGYRMEDFAPVANIVKVPYVLVVSARSPVRNLDDLARLARSRPSGLNSGIIGYGSVVHLTTEMLRQSTGIPMVHVPYRGGGPATTALIAGEIDIYVTGVVNGIPLVRSGTLRALGVAHDTRLPGAPEFPTFAEQGHPAILSSSYFGVLAPARTPAAIVQRLATEIGRAAEDPEFRAAMERDGAVIDTVSGEAFGRMMADDLAVWAGVIRRMGNPVQP